MKHLTCAECKLLFDTHEEYVAHANEMHELGGTIQTGTYGSELEFSEWFRTVTCEGKFEFVKPSGTNKNQTTTLYRCSRSGHYDSKDTGVRLRNKKNSRKINAECTCFLKVRREPEKSEISVEYCVEHLGHTLDVCHLPVSSDMKVSYL